MTETILETVDARGVATLTLNRPDRHNAFDDALIPALTETFIRLGADPGVRAEMTAGTRVGVHHYTFGKDKAAHLLLDLPSSLYNYPGKILWSSLRMRPDGTVTGSRTTRGWAAGRQLYFAMRFSAPVKSHAFVSTEKDVKYKGFQAPGRGRRWRWNHATDCAVMTPPAEQP